jgi:hypothetical protein
LILLAFMPVPDQRPEDEGFHRSRGDRWPRPPGLDRAKTGPLHRDRAGRLAVLDAFWLAAERQIAWAQGKLAEPPAGAVEMPPTRELFRTMWEVDQTWLPDIRSMCTEAELAGKAVTRLGSVDEVDPLKTV